MGYDGDQTLFTRLFGVARTEECVFHNPMDYNSEKIIGTATAKIGNKTYRLPIGPDLDYINVTANATILAEYRGHPIVVVNRVGRGYAVYIASSLRFSWNNIYWASFLSNLLNTLGTSNRSYVPEVLYMLRDLQARLLYLSPGSSNYDNVHTLLLEAYAHTVELMCKTESLKEIILLLSK